MCVAVRYQFKGVEKTSSFPDPDPQLPILLKGGGINLLPWGRKPENIITIMPPTGWARLEKIKEGAWDRWNPKPVKIPATSFMERDRDGRPHWFDLDRGQFIQGLLAYSQGDNEYRVYVVTVAPEGALSAIHDRWPRIV